jgi:hypothetical protein
LDLKPKLAEAWVIEFVHNSNINHVQFLALACVWSIIFLLWWLMFSVKPL